MLNRLRQLNKLWRLSKKDKAVMDEFMKLSDKEMMELPDEGEGAVFIGQGTEEELKEFEKEKKGFKGIFGL